MGILQGRVAVITGSTRGLGFGMALGAQALLLGPGRMISRLLREGWRRIIGS